jgi:hypothetical protein
MSWFSEIRKGISQAWREGREEFEKAHPRAATHASRLVQERRAGSGYSSSAAHSQQELLEMHCKRCGGKNLDESYSNSHRRCMDCGECARKEPAQWQLRPQTEQFGSTYTIAGFGNGGGVVINEFDLSGNLVGSRPATKRDMQAKPKAVQFCGIRAGRG